MGTLNYFHYRSYRTGHNYMVIYRERKHWQVVKAFRRHLRNRHVPFDNFDFKIVKRMVATLNARHPPE